MLLNEIEVASKNTNKKCFTGTVIAPSDFYNESVMDLKYIHVGEIIKKRIRERMISLV